MAKVYISFLGTNNYLPCHDVADGFITPEPIRFVQVRPTRTRHPGEIPPLAGSGPEQLEIALWRNWIAACAAISHAAGAAPRRMKLSVVVRGLIVGFSGVHDELVIGLAIRPENRKKCIAE